MTADRAPRAWSAGLRSLPVEHEPRLRFVLGPISDVQYEEAGVGESVVAFVYPELRLSYPYDDPHGTGATEITIASASCVIVRASGATDAMCEVDDDLAFISGSLEEAGRFSYGGSFLHVSDIVVDTFWRGGGLGPALVSLIAHECDVEAATLEPAPIRTVRSGAELTSRYYRNPSSKGRRSVVADAWQRAGFARIDDVPPDPDDAADADEWEEPAEPSSPYFVRMEDEGTHSSARARLAAARRCARGGDVRQWHDAKVRSVKRSARRRAASARRAADVAEKKAPDPQRVRHRARDLIAQRIERIMPTAGPWRGTDTILLEGAHVQVRVSGRATPRLHVQIVRYELTQKASDLAAILGELGAPVDSSWGPGTRTWTVVHKSPDSTSYSSYRAARAIVAALVDGLGRQPEEVLAGASESLLSPEPWDPGDLSPPTTTDAVVDDLVDLDLDYRDFVVTSRESRSHYSPRDADVPARFFLIKHEAADPRSDGDLVALAPRGGGSSAVVWYRHEGKGWYPDPTVPRRLRPGSGEVLRAISNEAALDIEASD